MASQQTELDEPEEIWLDQFAAPDRALAERLVRSDHHVGGDEFARQLQDKIIERVRAGPKLVALFVESERNHRAAYRTSCSMNHSARRVAELAVRVRA